MFIFTTIFFLLLVQLLSVASSSSTTPVAVPTTMAVDAHSRQSSESGDEKDSDVDECGSCGLGDCGRWGHEHGDGQEVQTRPAVA